MTDEFGTHLAALLEEKNAHARAGDIQWAPSRLALLLRVDVSLVRRWLRGERVPAVGSRYVEAIADVLELGPKQRQALQRAQLRSLRARAARRPGQADEAPGRGRMSLAPAARPPGASAGDRRPRARAPDPQAWSLPTAKELLEFAREVLGRLPRLRAHAATILVAQQGQELAQLTAALSDQWVALMADVLDRGWDVECLLRLPDDAAGLLSLVYGFLALCSSAGALRLRYFSDASTPPVPYSLMVVPERLALLGLAARQDRAVDAVLRVADPASVATLRDHLLQLRRHTAPLFTTYPPVQQLAFEEDLADAGRRDCRHLYVVDDGLSVVTLPRDWARADNTWVRSRARGRLDPRIYAATLRERLDQAHACASARSLRLVCPLAAIERWLEYGIDGPDVRPVQDVPVTPAERLERVRNMVAMLEEYRGFDLGLWDTTDGALPDSQWQVHADHSVFVTCRRGVRNRRSEPLRLRIEQPELVAAFDLAFEQLWVRIPPGRRSKEEVARWLRARINAYAAARRRLG